MPDAAPSIAWPLFALASGNFGLRSTHDPDARNPQCRSGTRTSLGTETTRHRLAWRRPSLPPVKRMFHVKPSPAQERLPGHAGIQ